MKGMQKLVFRDILQKTNFYMRIQTKGRMSGRDRYNKIYLDNDIRRILNLDTKLRGMGIEQFVNPSNINNIYTRLEVLMGLELQDIMIISQKHQT